MKNKLLFFLLLSIISNYILSNISFAQTIAITGGTNHSLSLRSDNTVWDWGNNYSGQLGDGTTTDRHILGNVSGLIDIIAIAGGQSHSLFLKNDGTVWAVGNNQYGQLGVNSGGASVPVMVTGLTGITAIAGGWSHSMALKSDGTVWAWGNNQSGQLGNGTLYNNSSTPTQVSSLTGIIAIAGGRWHSLALKNDGTVWAWGHGGLGALGNNIPYDQATPVQVSGLSGIKAIAGGGTHSMALKNDNTVWVWGDNSKGQIGDITTTQRNIPVQVHGAGNVGFLTDVVAISGGEAYSLALKNDSTVWTWGQNNFGQLGDSSTIDRYTPIQVHGPGNVGFLKNIITISAGGQHILTIKKDGTMWTCGYNAQGQLGDSSIINRYVPVKVNEHIGITTVTQNSLSRCPGNNISVSYKATGPFITGNIFTVQLSNANGSFASPTNIGSLNTVSSGTITCTIPIATPAGTGYRIRVVSSNPVTTSNDNGANISIYSLPVVTANATATNIIWGTLVTLTGGGASSYLWAGGNGVTNGVGFYPSTNTYTVTGTDGNSCSNTATITITVNPLPASASPHTISGGEESSFSICSDSTVRAWGRNDYGQLGDGTTTAERRIPVLVSGLTSILSLSKSLALKKDGTVWQWGVHVAGTNLMSTTPVQVPGPDNIGFLTNIIAISNQQDNFYHTGHALALKNDGTVWAWGNNYSGQLGNGDSTFYIPTPVQVHGPGNVGFLTNIIAISAGDNFSLALKNDGTVWSWGYNNNGQLGNGTATCNSCNDNLVPEQVHGPGNVGFLSGITAIEAGSHFSIALKNDSTVWAWGWNGTGELGDGTPINTNGRSSVPVQVHGLGNIGFLTGIISIASGWGHSIALKKDSTILVWGNNTYGELGDGTIGHRNIPVQVKDQVEITEISAGGIHSMALKKDGTVWAWGNNSYGQIGDGTNTHRHTPMQVVGPCMIPGTLSAIMNIKNATSCNVNDGSITAIISGGTAPYTYSWSNGQTTSAITGLSIGTYTATVTDINNYTSTTVATINNNFSLNISSILPVSCFGGSNGSAVLSVSGGVSPLSYLWSSGQTTTSVMGLSAANYSVTVSDVGGCTQTATVTITQPTVLGNTATSFTNVSCYGGNNGSATVNPSGGTPTYTYLWNSSGQTTQTATGLVIGNHTVTVSDHNGCIHPIYVAITQPAVISTSVTIDNATCGGNNGSANVIAAGGTTPFTYSWNPSGQTTQTGTGLGAGNFTCTITDKNGCTNTTTATITASSKPTIVANATLTSICSGTSVTLTGSGATSYAWSGGVTNGIGFIPSSTNTYTVTGTDGNGCTNTATTTITVNPKPIVTANPASTIICAGYTLILNGGGATSYAWSNGVTNGVGFVPTSTSTYTVTGTSGNGCTNTATTTITVEPKPTVTANASATTICSGTSVTLTGGGAATYAWFGGVTNGIGFIPTATNTYSVVGTTANGCKDTTTTTVNVTSLPTVTANATVSTLCLGSSTTLIGGGATSYVWSGGVSNGVGFIPTSTSTYTVTGTGANGCTNTATTTITLNPKPNVTANTNISTVCANFPVILTGGGATSYTWSGGVSNGVGFVPTLTNTYTVTGTGANGCTNTATTTITVEPKPIVTANASSTTVCSGNSVTLTGGGAATYVWSAGITNGVGFIPTSTNTYTVVGTTANGCKDTTTITITVNNLPTVTANAIVSSLCLGRSTTLIGGGATSYIWSNGVTNGVGFIPSSTSTYTLTGTDANGCTNTATTSITVNSSPLLTISKITPAGCKFSNGSISVNVNGGSPAYTYAWLPSGGSASIATALGVGNYSLTVTDANGCTHTFNTTIGDSCNYVWPGDANDDGIADNQDILAIGIGYGKTGPVRPGASLNWIGQPCNDWTDTLVGKVNYKNIDCNGDGIIGYADTNAVKLNYGLTHHNKNGNVVTNGNTDLYLVFPSNTINSGGELVTVQIGLGTSSAPASTIYGLAFKINFSNPALVDPTSISFKTQNSWLGTMGTDLMAIGFNNSIPQSVDAAIVRTNHQNTNGFGTIATLKFKTSNSLNGTGTTAPLVISISDPTVIAYNQTVIPVNALSGSVIVKDTLIATGINELIESQVLIYPNPTSSFIKIFYPINTTEISILDVLGRIIYHSTDPPLTKSSSINLSDQPAGVYFLKVKTGSGVFARKIVKE